jgi:hypothetical protein
MARAAASPLLKATLVHHLREYADFHPNRARRAIAAAATLLSGFGLLAGLSNITVFAPGGNPIHLGHLFAAVAVLGYARFSAPLALFLAPIAALSFPFAAIMPKALIALCGVVGLSLHASELAFRATRPSLFQLWSHIVLGPLFFAAVLLGMWPTRKAALAL